MYVCSFIVVIIIVFVSLAAELLREAEKLVAQKIHPQTIIAGWRRATQVAQEALLRNSLDNRYVYCNSCHSFLLYLFSANFKHYFSGNIEKFKEDLLNIARTTLSSKILSQHKEHFAKLAVQAVLRLKGSGDLSAIQIIKKKGGCLEDSFLDEG